MSEKFLISGGIPRTLGELMSGHAFKRAELAEVDFDQKTYTSQYSHITPAQFCADHKPSIGFTGLCLFEDKIFIATRTEVLLLSKKNYSLIAIITDPLFNDIHHVCIINNFLYVAVTGLDAVFQYDLKTYQKNIYNVLQKNPFHRFNEKDLLNKRVSLKPHESHPNYIFEINGDPWVTRLKQKDAISLVDPSKRIVISEGLPHDGFRKNEFVYFTTVNGYIVKYQIHTLKKVRSIKLSGKPSQKESPLGWCRGLYVDDDFFYVCFSQLRTTKVTENLIWLKSMMEEKRMFDKPAPTRIEKYTLAGKYVDSFVLPKKGITTIFNIEKI